MALTTEEKNSIVQQVLAEIYANSNDITSLDSVQSLDGVSSLPARKGSNLVSVPINLLSKPATDAATQVTSIIQQANTILSDADDATTLAVNAAQNANTATTSASNAAQDANMAADSANEAAITANDAANDATSAAQGLNDYKTKTNAAYKGATAVFYGIVSAGLNLSAEDAGTKVGSVVFDTGTKSFVYKVDGGLEIQSLDFESPIKPLGSTYYKTFSGDDFYNYNGKAIIGKVFLLNNVGYVYDGSQFTELNKQEYKQVVLNQLEFNNLSEVDDNTIYYVYDL